MSSTLETSSSIIQQMASVIGQARVNITQITSGIYDQESRDRTAEAINDLLEQLVQLANTKYNDQYLFGGADTGSAPYAVERADGEITAVTYQGSMESRNVNVAPGVSARRVSTSARNCSVRTSAPRRSLAALPAPQQARGPPA